MPRLSEPDLRRPGFREGRKVALADGQEWTFPPPALRFFPAVGDDGRVCIASQYAYDEAYLELRDELIQTDKGDHWNAMRIQVTIAGTLLLANYDLKTADLARLLPVIPDSPDNDAMWERLTPVLLARAPRSFPDGSAARASQPGSPDQSPGPTP